MNHTVYTRHTYPPGDERHGPRLELAKRTSIRSMLHSRVWTTRDVRWVWWAHPQHRTEIVDAIRDEGYLGELHILHGDVVLEDDDIQTTLDSDDMISAHFLDRVQAHYEPEGETKLVTWQPTKLELETGNVYRARMRYDGKTPSMFYSIYHPTPEIRVYARTHTKMGELCPSELDPFPGTTAVIHDANHLMTIHDDEEILEPMKTYATAKIQGARVTGAELEYEGSVTLGESLMSWAGIEEGELVHINSLESGAHWETYAIQGEGTEVCLNGPPALLFEPGDRIVIVRYELLEAPPSSIQVVTYRAGELVSAVNKSFRRFEVDR